MLSTPGREVVIDQRRASCGCNPAGSTVLGIHDQSWLLVMARERTNQASGLPMQSGWASVAGGQQGMRERSNWCFPLRAPLCSFLHSLLIGPLKDSDYDHRTCGPKRVISERVQIEVLGERKQLAQEARGFFASCCAILGRRWGWHCFRETRGGGGGVASALLCYQCPLKGFP